jgi:hypothetical protein
MQHPAVIMVWMQTPLAGLGDLLRGTVHLHELSQRLKFRLVVDTQLHPISKFLISNSHEYSEYVLQNKDSVLNLVNSTTNSEDVIKDYLMHPDSKQNPILLICNNMENINIAPGARANSFIRAILTPTEEFKTEFNAMCAAFKITSNYSILHLRLGDDDLVRRAVSIQKYNEILKIIDAHIVNNGKMLIIADSWAFKQYLCHVRPQLTDRVIPTKPVHLSHTTDQDAHMIKETLFDLFLLINSNLIKTYTTYTWVSGFVQWVSYAFNIPMISINHSNAVFRTPHIKSTQPMHNLKLNMTMNMMNMKPKPPNVKPPNVKPPNVKPLNIKLPNVKPPNMRPLNVKPQFRLFRFI